ncbi:MAG: AbrB/MazE/SpoVT family DNA-binding domain-containing protein [Bacteroidota bacterium]
MTLKVDKFGRILIPKAIRKYLEVEPGDELALEINRAEKSVVLSSEAHKQEATLSYDASGFPLIEPAGKFPVDLPSGNSTKEVYDDYFKKKLGL